MVQIRVRELITAVTISVIVGMIVFRWQWLTQAIGLDIHVIRSNSPVTFEYFIGMTAAIGLGFAFPTRPVVCAVSLMLGPNVVSTAILVIGGRIPNLWPLELLFLLVLTIPYIGLAYVGAYLRKRMGGSSRDQTKEGGQN
jgi:hypothetical protein